MDNTSAVLDEMLRNALKHQQAETTPEKFVHESLDMLLDLDLAYLHDLMWEYTTLNAADSIHIVLCYTQIG